MAVAGVVAVVGRERIGSGGELGAAVSGVHHLVADEDAGFRGEGGAEGGEDGDAVGVGPVVSVGEIREWVNEVFCCCDDGAFISMEWGKLEGLQDAAHPIDVGAVHGVRIEEVVHLEVDVSVLKELRGGLRPECFSGLLDDFGAVLAYTLQMRVGGQKLDDEPAWV